MRRSPRFVVASCTAVLVGTGTAFVVAGDLTALHRRARNLGPVHSVVVAAGDIPLGAVIGPGDLTAVDRHESTVPPDAVRTADDAIGRVVSVPVVQGAVVQATHLAPADRTGLDGVIPAGRRAVRVTTSDGTQPEPGTVVDVLAALDPSVVGGSGRAVLVAAGARVLALDDDAPADEYANGGAGGVTLLVTEEEAYDLAFATANGVLTLAVAPPEAACCTLPEP